MGVAGAVGAGVDDAGVEGCVAGVLGAAGVLGVGDGVVDEGVEEVVPPVTAAITTEGEVVAWDSIPEDIAVT